MKKLFAAVLLVALSFFAFPVAAQAAPPSNMGVQRVPAWNVTGDYTIGFDCGTCVPHYIQITSYNVYTGAFSGSGYYVANPAFTWTVSGSVSGNQVSMRILYTGANAGYYVDLSGTIAPDGSMSGTAIDSSGSQFGWVTTAGHATAYTTHGNFVCAQDNKQLAARTNFGKPLKP